MSTAHAMTRFKLVEVIEYTHQKAKDFWRLLQINKATQYLHKYLWFKDKQLLTTDRMDV